MPNKLNIQRVFFLFGYLYPFLSILCSNEFDKMQIPYTAEYSDIPYLYIVCLATTGICVFVR